ncbi:DgyrCDS9098 [Dimorphilus gyrociliatus]|uniref:DgyrCDS9098 n=1 Tax=Dimorphilus gyrociliatus TaxID=2664684 RepID=A0A7I8VWE6_9ANNE|nr:DgyrCDS9098 [Dimorphilus gyrociliatus]
MAAERNFLMEDAYPKLRKYCKERFGLEFEVVDMRWGIPEMARNDHSTVQLCMNEIELCKKSSIGPFFIAFIGQKHGYQPLPSSIKKEEFEKLISAIRDEREKDLVNQWYKCDYNNKNPNYVLLAVDEVLNHDEYDKFFNHIEVNLKDILLKAARICTVNGTLPQAFLDALHSSVTHLEIEQALGTGNAKSSRAVCLIRTIADLSSHLDERRSCKFIDLIPQSISINKKAQESLARMKTKYIEKFHSVLEHTTQWSSPNGVDSKDHLEYLQKMSVQIHDKLRKMITYAATSNKSYDGELFAEVVKHWRTARARSSKFIGRQNILMDVRKYILKSSDEALVLYGEAGHGKTSLMTKIASSVRTWLETSGRRGSVILRLCGTTAKSGNVHQLLRSICEQVAFVSNTSKEIIPDTYSALKTFWLDQMRGEFGGLLVIILDAVDQLSNADNAHRLDWIPARLHTNVKIIVSTLPDDLLFVLKSKIRNDDDHIIYVPPLEIQDCATVCKDFLSSHGRCLTDRQFELVKAAFKECSLPLYVNLVNEQCMNWCSFTPENKMRLDTTLQAAIQTLFQQLEVKYGQVFVMHSISYLTASRSGISQSEMNDILSIDDDVLNEIFAYWEPPIRRIPPSLWTRVLHDMSSYIVERESDETLVYNWYHEQFRRVSLQRYLQDTLTLYKIHTTMADYWTSLWCGTVAKPFTYTDHQMKRFNLAKDRSSAHRYVAEQPLVYQTFIDNCRGDGTRYNIRKLNELPYHLAKANRIKHLRQLVFFNLSWLHTKLKACGIQPLLADFGLCKFRDVSLVEDAIRMAESALVRNPDLIGVELTGRLLPHFNDYPTVRDLIQQCDLAAPKLCPMIPVWQCYLAPGGPLHYVCEIDSRFSPQRDVVLIEKEDSILLAAKPLHEADIRLWDIQEGEARPEVKSIAGSKLYPSPNGTFVHGVRNNRFFCSTHLNSGECQSEINFGHNNIASVFITENYAALAYEQSPSPALIDLKERKVLKKLDYSCSTLAISSDEKLLACNSGRCITIHSIPNLERVAVLQGPDTPVSILFLSDSFKFYVRYKNHEIQMNSIRPSSLQKNKSSSILKDIELKDTQLSNDSSMLLARATRCLYILDTSNNKLLTRISKMPPGLFSETMTPFKVAGFAYKDSFVVGARHTYIGVWKSRCGTAVRLLQPSINQISALFTPSKGSRIVSITADNTIQVWNMENLDADIQHNNALAKAEISSLDLSKNSSKLIVQGKLATEAQIFDIGSGKVEHVLKHIDDFNLYIDYVKISSSGNYAITSATYEVSDVPEYTEAWKKLRESKLWMLEDNSMKNVLTFKNCRTVFFCSYSETAFFLTCSFYSTYDWPVKKFDIQIIQLPSLSARTMEVPDGDLISTPVTTASGQVLAMLIQQSQRIRDKKTHKEIRRYEQKLCLFNLSKTSTSNCKLLSINDFLKSSGEEAMIDLKDSGKNLIIMFGKQIERLEYDSDGFLIHEVDCPKSAIVFDAEKQINLQVLNSNGSNIGTQIPYPQRKSKNIALLPNLDMKTIVSVVNKTYLISLSEDHRELILINGETFDIVSSLFIHGRGTELKVANDDRTIVLGCNDGRLLIVTLTVGLTDHIKEHLNLLPSRRSITNQKNILSEDIKRANFFHISAINGKILPKTYGKMINIAQRIKTRKLVSKT